MPSNDGPNYRPGGPVLPGQPLFLRSNLPGRVEIRRVGRWTYRLSLYPPDRISDFLGLEGPTVLGRRRAESRARRELRRMQREDERRTPVAVITAEQEGGPNRG